MKEYTVGHIGDDGFKTVVPRTREIVRPLASLIDLTIGRRRWQTDSPSLDEQKGHRSLARDHDLEVRGNAEGTSAATAGVNDNAS
jgi:hypothetical protein